MAPVTHVRHEREHRIALVFPDIVAPEHIDGIGVSGFDGILEHLLPAGIVVEIVVIIGLAFEVQERAVVERLGFLVREVEVIGAEMIPRRRHHIEALPVLRNVRVNLRAS